MLLDRVWFWLICIGILYGLGKGVLHQVYPPETVAVVAAADGEPDAESAKTSPSDDDGSVTDAPVWPVTAQGQRLTDEAIGAAELAVTICLQLIGVMALWLGMLRIAQAAGMVDALASLLRPVMRWLFPGVPDGHPAQGAMLMNISANMLGLDNAATPFGVKAMRELEELNPHEGTATDAMAMFLAINTSSITLIPISIIALRAANGSESPASPISGMFLATCVSTAVAIVMVRWLQTWPRFSVSAAVANQTAQGELGETATKKSDSPAGDGGRKE